MKLPRNFKTNFSLKNNNSFRLDYLSKIYLDCNSFEDLERVYEFLLLKKNKFWVIGEGTNLIL